MWYGWTRKIFLDPGPVGRLSVFADWKAVREWYATTMRGGPILLSGLCEKRGIAIPDQLSVVSIEQLGPANPGRRKTPPSLPLWRRWAEGSGKNMISMIENPYFDGNYLFDSDIIEAGFGKGPRNSRIRRNVMGAKPVQKGKKIPRNQLG